jgi:chromodomain-helicase-DNA-binding protein 7
LLVDRVLAVDQKGPIYLVKWQGMEYDQASWEGPEYVPPERIRELMVREQVRVPTNAGKRGRVKTPALEQGEPQLRDIQLRDYQLEGFRWLRKCYCDGRNNILADEMGLGKTLQVISLLNDIAAVGCPGPFLMVAPVSTLSHWKMEFEGATSLNVVVYIMGRPSRVR